MSGRLTAASMAFACCLALCGCGKGGSDNAAQTERGAQTEKAAQAEKGAPGAGVDAVVRELGEFTDELERAFESASKPRDGVDAAQKLLDARRAALAARIAAFKTSPQFQADAEARRKWLEAEVDNTDRVSRLQVKYMDAKMRDPDFKARLDKLVEDYNLLFKDSAAR
ncbi:MAG: hypothetical protein M3444_10195 [Acidobacteriota bacterium]|nr:hypothetical protein [Acidobacteriota bacterium]MDQ5837628.1 hypothetical protein [Acidobacteriota bacterium]